MKFHQQQSSSQYSGPALDAVTSLGLDPVRPPFDLLTAPPRPGSEPPSRRWTPGPADPAVPGRSLWLPATHRDAVERSVRRSLGEQLALTDHNVEEVVKLEGLFGDWQRARSVKFAAWTLHQAAVKVDPIAADIWAPRPLRPRRGSRARFLHAVQLLWRARERGGLHARLAEEEMAILCEDLAWRSSPAATAPSRGARRCEGRSRAPQGSAGGARAGSGASRRGGGDRGDDSGGGGSDGSGGGSPGSGRARPWRFNWRVAAAIAGVASTFLATATFFFGPLYTQPPTPVTVAPQVILKEVQAPAPPPRVIVITGAHRRRVDATTEVEGGVEP